MGKRELPLEHAHETIEHHAHGSSEPWVMGVALTAALLAALAAITALNAEDKVTEAIVERMKASDQWSLYQAKSIKENLLQSKMAIQKSLGKSDDAEDSGNLSRYKAEKEEILVVAKKLEEESEKHLQEHVPFSRGLTMFQVAIAIGAISVLTKRREFWFVCLAFGLAGVAFFLRGFMV